jgi:hypothetical protein
LGLGKLYPARCIGSSLKVPEELIGSGSHGYFGNTRKMMPTTTTTMSISNASGWFILGAQPTAE